MIRPLLVPMAVALALLHVACEGPAGPEGAEGPQGPPGSASGNVELVTVRITEEDYGELYDPYRKVVAINDLRVWVSLDDARPDANGSSLVGVYVRRLYGSQTFDFELIPVELWLQAQPDFGRQAYGEILLLREPGVVYIIDPNELLLGQTVVLAVLTGSPRTE